MYEITIEWNNGHKELMCYMDLKSVAQAMTNYNQLKECGECKDVYFKVMGEPQEYYITFKSR